MFPKTHRFFAAAVCLILLSAVSYAQSGRKQKKVETQPPVQGVNQPDKRVQPEPDVEEEKPKEKEKRRAVMVATSMPDISLPMYYADSVRQGCLNELREDVKSVVLTEGRNQTRSEAIKAAKEDDTMYVVLIDLEYDRMGTTGTGVDLRYTIFEPKTAKVVGTGTGYPSQPTSRLPIPPVGASREQVYLDWAGRDIARQVIKRLGLGP